MQLIALLLFILALIVAGILLLLLQRKKQPRVYKPKGPYLLSPGEKRFFDALRQSLPPGLYICPKVRVADLIDIRLERDAPDFWKHLAPINQKHVDFVLVTSADFAPQVAIELDGGSHNDKERAKRDSFIDSVFQNAGIPILHIPVKGFYDYAALRHQITAAIPGAASMQSGRQ